MIIVGIAHSLDADERRQTQKNQQSSVFVSVLFLEESIEC